LLFRIRIFSLLTIVSIAQSGLEVKPFCVKGLSGVSVT